MIGRSILHNYVRVSLELNYRSLENPRSNWVVVVGLELLSLECPGLGLGSCYVHQLCLCHPIIMMVILILLVENRIWGDGIGTCRCDADGSRLFPVRWSKPVVSYHSQI
jgi:hypothetical protein